MGVLGDAIGVFVVFGLPALVLIAVVVGLITLEKADQRRQYQRHVQLIASGKPIPTFDEWQAWKRKPRTNHNRHPSDGL